MKLANGMVVLAVLAILHGSSGRVAAKELDLKNRHAGMKLRGFLESLAQGNEAEVVLQKLTLDTVKGTVNTEFFFRHRHALGRLTKEKTLDRVPLYSYDENFKVAFSYNARYKFGHKHLDLGRGVILDTKKIQRLIKDEINLVAEWKVEPVFQGTSYDDYEVVKDAYEATHDPDRIYFASKSFTDWAATSTAGKWVQRAVTTSGSAAVKAGLAEAKSEALKEVLAVTAWLRKRGVREPRGFAEALLRGERVNSPFLVTRWQAVGYWTRNKLSETEYSPWVRDTHSAFVLIWQQKLSNNAHPLVSPEKYQSVVGFTNKTQLVINYQFRWSGRENWENKKIKPGETQVYAIAEMPIPQVQYDYDLSERDEFALFTLDFNSIPANREAKSSDVRMYAFSRDGNTLRLDSVTK